MTHEPNDSRDDLLQELLQAVERDAPPPDPAVLEALRLEAADLFAASHPPDTSLDPLPAATPAVRPDRSSTMMLLLLRGSLALLASIAVLAAWLVPIGPGPVSAAVPFAKVLEELGNAATLQLELSDADGRAEILIRAPGLVRKQESPHRYQIAVGSRLWKIDEADNTVTEHDSPWFASARKQIDLLALLDLQVKDAGRLLSSQPRRRIAVQGRTCDVYVATLPTAAGPMELEALADATTHEFISLLAREPGAAADAPPRAELRLIARNVPADDDKFTVATTLTQDGRIGKISASQGIVSLRPMLAKRWTPVGTDVLLRTGDWIRTELRGANAVRVRLTSDAELTLGPGSLVELHSATVARVHRGQVQVSRPARREGTDATSFTLRAPRTGAREIAHGEKILLRVNQDDAFVDMPQPPLWLTGFEGTTNQESLGSLIVNLPDGRSEPLSVGYHKVTVEIRDQIARTTIEESFVNHTRGRLEGVFHFPLPQDASISGFGMWIGDELVEADVVEKQRAREIFETILREKRDPGLLEWMGGNIFKARVFPIEPNSEKRIKIVYTQVLPLRGNQYRYSYGLRSELLRTRPLRELSLSVLVNSALPLKSVTSATHAVRTQQTAHSAQLEFDAQEYIPTRDFEVVCELATRQSDVVAIPHRRGDDGYFLVQLMPPGPAGQWQRELLPDGNPVHVVLLCDTSSSMDVEKRRQQSEFVASVLASLGDDDRFQLACADVSTAWITAEPAVPDEAAIQAARTALETRRSLGWTNLDRAFRELLAKVPASAHVIYIGDGIVNAGSSDAAAFVQRFQQLIGNEKGARRTFHAVTVGNSYESVALKGIARAGGGSLRAITEDIPARAVALELLNEITQPGLRDLKVEFRGVKVAAVYPDQLPNVAAGTQQILVGRYLPEGQDQSGEILVTGRLGQEQVRYTATLNLKDAEEGNSFLPRLWARAHLDHLLAQGPSSRIRDEIIALSEQFHIMTPYTSLLVLETDADRERFGVKRRFGMRDGERFFAEGRDNATFELAQDQMRRAGTWRVDWRRRVLRDLRQLGRDPHEFDFPFGVVYSDFGMMNGMSSFGFGMGGFGGMGGSGGGFGGGMGGGMGGGSFGGAFDSGMDGTALDGGEWREVDEVRAAEQLHAVLGLNLADTDLESDVEILIGAGDQDFDGIVPSAGEPVPGQMFWKELDFRLPGRVGKRKAWEYSHRIYSPFQSYTNWVPSIFPALEPARPDVAPSGDWTPEALALSRALARSERLQQLAGGLQIRRTVKVFEPRWNRQMSEHNELQLYSPAGWLHRSLDPAAQTIVQYRTERERGCYSLAFLLGRRRASRDRDLLPPTLGLNDSILVGLNEMPDRKGRVEPAGDGRVRLTVTQTVGVQTETYLIETARNVVLNYERHSLGSLVESIEFSDFREAGGLWWACKSTLTNPDGLFRQESTLDIKDLERPAFLQVFDQELAAREQVQFVDLPLVSIATARQHVADGRASFNDRLALFFDLTSRQDWSGVRNQLTEMERSVADKPGIRWLRPMLESVIRDEDSARLWLLDEARALAAAPRQDDVFLAGFILETARGLCSPDEQLEFLEVLRPVYDRLPQGADARATLLQSRIQALEEAGKIEAALELRKRLATDAPWMLDGQLDYAHRLAAAGRNAEARAWLIQELERPVERTAYERESLQTALAEQLRTSGDWEALLKRTEAWMEAASDSQSYNSPYAIYLSTLVYLDQSDRARDVILGWMKDARVPGQMSGVQRARLEAAINFASGNTYQIQAHRWNPDWQDALGDLVRYFAGHPHHHDVARKIMGFSAAQQTETFDRLRGEFLSQVRADAATLDAGTLQRLVTWTLSGRITLTEPWNGRRELDISELPNAWWESMFTVIETRWKQSQDPKERQILGATLADIASSRLDETRQLALLREQVATAEPEFRSAAMLKLYDRLLTAVWSPDIERETFETWRRLSSETDPQLQLVTLIPQLYSLVDAMIENREDYERDQVRDQGNQQTRTREELAREAAARTTRIRTELARRLLELAKAEAGNPLADWLQIEASWLQVRADTELPQVVARCWALLDRLPPAPSDTDEPEPGQQLFPTDEASPLAVTTRYERVLHDRALTTLLWLATRRSATAADITRVLNFIDAGIARETGPAEGTAVPPNAWRQLRVSMLVALDRVEELERDLRKWIETDVSTAPWRSILARLQAERGALPEAIALLAAGAREKLLNRGDYQLLADLYLATGQRAEYETIRLAALQETSEQELHERLQQLSSLWRGSDETPGTLDDETRHVFGILFQKTSEPDYYFDELRECYQATRDFRLLRMLPDAMLGRTPRQIYRCLSHLTGQILNEIHDEATTDELTARLRELRTDGRSAVDLRALDLLEVLVERRAAEQLDQPGPHQDACLAAMKRAFNHPWADGEPALMASLLVDLGTLPEPLAAEQLRELRVLQTQAPAGSRIHLQVTRDLARAIGEFYGRPADAIQLMEPVFRAYLQSHDHHWPPADYDSLNVYLGLLEQTGRFTAGESVLNSLLEHPFNETQREWLIERRMELYTRAFDQGGAVSLGSGRDELLKLLYRSFLQNLQDATTDAQRLTRATRVVDLLEMAHRHQTAGTRPLLEDFAFTQIPRTLARQILQYRELAVVPIRVVAPIAGPTAAVRYLVERLEQYPERLDMTWDNAWNVFGSEVAHRRREAGPTEFDDRLLQRALRELRRELLTGDHRSSTLFRVAHEYWKEKEPEFIRTANALLVERPSGRTAASVARYFWDGLIKQDRAIEVLFTAYAEGRLDLAGQTQLVNWLLHLQRYAEAIPVLESLVRLKPDAMQERTQLMTAYFQSKRPNQLEQLVQATHDHFHQQGRWTEDHIAMFGRACLDCELTERAEGYLTEAIALHQRANPQSGRNDETLASYYDALARACSKQGKTRAAVDACAAAIVCWSLEHEERQQHIQTLREVLETAEDLDDFVAFLDAESTRTGQDQPLIRKYLGLTYQNRPEYDKAIAQLERAIALSPNDPELHEQLVACYDAADQTESATRQLLAWIDLQPHNLELYQQLEQRLRDNEVEADRAATSIVEAAPLEAANHAALAELREQQDRWAEAIEQWRQVAELRSLEPTGLLRLAAAQIHEQDWPSARTTLKRLHDTTWPSQFPNIKEEIRALEEQLPQ